MSLTVALLSPTDPRSLRGNAITVNRVAMGLRNLGVGVHIWDCSAIPTDQLKAEVKAYNPQLIHAFHAYRVGPLAMLLGDFLDIPFLVTITGTDANQDLYDPARTEIVQEVLAKASKVVVFHDSMREKIRQILPIVADKAAVIPQSVELEDGPAFALQERVDLHDECVVFLSLGGVRAVKNLLFPLEPFDRLVTQYPLVRLIYAGPILEPSEGERLFSALLHRPWASYLGEVPHNQMRSLLEAVHVVLNCSHSESMPNSVLEAMVCARPILASDIDGTRSLVKDGVTGFLFRNHEDFKVKATRLVEDPELRMRLGKSGQSRAQTFLQVGIEADDYLAQYHLATA